MRFLLARLVRPLGRLIRLQSELIDRLLARDELRDLGDELEVARISRSSRAKATLHAAIPSPEKHCTKAASDIFDITKDDREGHPASIPRENRM
jgi:hypothetical protein